MHARHGQHRHLLHIEVIQAALTAQRIAQLTDDHGLRGAFSLHFEGTNAQQESADEGGRNRIDSLRPFSIGVSGMRTPAPLPGSHLKQNYSLIGPGVTQSSEQIVNIHEPHGFNIGAAAMPKGVTNNLHLHFTAGGR